LHKFYTNKGHVLISYKKIVKNEKVNNIIPNMIVF